MIDAFMPVIEDETIAKALMSRIAAVILFDSPNRSDSRRFDDIFNQVSFAGLFDIDLRINERLSARVVRNTTSAALTGARPIWGREYLLRIAGTASRSCI
jgi:hypothetical protein